MRIVFVCGSLGMGKSELLRAWYAQCARDGVRVRRLDARRGGDAIRRAIAGEGANEPSGAGPETIVVDDFDVLVDSHEAIADDLATQSSRDVQLVVATHAMPSGSWLRLAPEALVVVSLAPIDHDAALGFLEAAGVREDARESICAFARGVPLLLALGAERSRMGVPAQRIEDTVCEQIAQHLLAMASDEAHVAGLIVLTVARFTTLEIMSEALPNRASSFATYRWLCALPFVDCAPAGVEPHDVARRALDVHFARQHPASYARVHGALQRYCLERIREGSGVRWFFDWAFLGRHVPLLREYLAAADAAPRFSVGAARSDDAEAIVEIADVQLGASTARCVRAWLATPDAACVVVRDGTRVVAFSLRVNVTGNCALPVDDASVAAVLAHCRRCGWVDERTSGPLTFFRAWGARDAGQRGSPATAHLIMAHVRQFLTASMRFAVIAVRDPAGWLELLSSFAMTTIAIGTTDGDGERATTLLVADWSSRAPADALMHAAARTELAALDRVPAPPPAVVPTTPPAPPDADEESDLSRMLQRRIEELSVQARLSRREREVLQLLFMGRNTEEIGIALGITARTAKFHQAGVLRKVGADSRLDLLRILL